MYQLCQAENTADSAAVLASSTFFRGIMDGTEGKEPDLRSFEPLERVVLTSNGNLQRLIRSASSEIYSPRIII